MNLIFTSPPYAFKRKYTNEGEELGGENTTIEYVENLVNHLEECYRVLNHKGSFFLN